ncbi:esterase/lipase family protein [Streptomyces poonensis]|uniref:Uncharacterized protein n=1 Tax=Streptomyces poonensis TaxID=68255 RepID=A0A918PTS6_9ACTN|nr:hypothetical protein [Streptomyces poonensis]GGZ20963.1 hypothetical protein GCM10010365_46640 [Streptomyces poonensis]
MVLVHGTGSSAVLNWGLLAPHLVRRGYCVFALEYGRTGPPLIHGLGPIEDSARHLDDYVDRVRAATGTRKVDLVVASQGDLMPRYCLKFHRREAEAQVMGVAWAGSRMLVIS